MKLTLFGATGKTGKHLIGEALEHGAEVTVFARPRSSFQNPNVRVVRGELTDHRLLEEAIRGADAVLSALGPTSARHGKNMPITKAMDAITAVMRSENVRRLIAVSTGTAADPQDAFDLKIWLPGVLIRFAMPGSYRDMIGLADSIRRSGLGRVDNHAMRIMDAAKCRNARKLRAVLS